MRLHPLHRAVASVADLLSAKPAGLAIAESCTGGLAAHMATDIPGSSRWFRGSVTAYTNAVKTEALGVSKTALAEHGAVSRQVAAAMAVGVGEMMSAEASFAVTGLAGPGRGESVLPVGSVWIAWAVETGVQAEFFRFHGLRREIKRKAATAAWIGLAIRLSASQASSVGA